MSIEPVELPKQSTSTCVQLRLGPPMLFTVAGTVSAQELGSVALKLEGPDARFVRSWVVIPPVQLYVYGLVPPVTVRSIEPLERPQVASVFVVLKVNTEG